MDRYFEGEKKISNCVIIKAFIHHGFLLSESNATLLDVIGLFLKK